MKAITPIPNPQAEQAHAWQAIYNHCKPNLNPFLSGLDSVLSYIKHLEEHNQQLRRRIQELQNKVNMT